jgi:hypothetical protein
MQPWRYTEFRPTVGYGEKVTCKGGSYWWGRYKIAPGRYGTVASPDGSVRKFRRKLDAKRAADAEETRQPVARTVGRTTFAAYVARWLPAQVLDDDTIDTYRSIIACHLVPAFGGKYLDEITPKAIGDWERAQRAAG